MCIKVSVINAFGEVTGTQGSPINNGSYADHLFNEKDYYRAITEYKRIIFHRSKNYDLAGYANYRIGLCYFYANKWSDAQFWFSNVAQSVALPWELRRYAQLQIARCYQHTGNFIWARFELDDLYRRHKQKDALRQEILFWRSWNYLEQCQWDLSHNSFQQLCREFPASELYPLAEEMGNAAIIGKSLPKRSPKLAVRLSTFLPGAGQIYSGELLNGVTAAVINGILIYLIARSLKERAYLNTMGLIAFELRFYQGNLYTAKIDARSYNRKIVEKYLCSLRSKYLTMYSNNR